MSAERVTAEMLKLLAAPDPAPAVASMASTGAVAQILPGADHAALAVLIHVEEQADLTPDPIRRLAVLGGDPISTFRLSNIQAKHLAQLKSDMSHVEAAYRFGAALALDRLAIEAASLGHEIDSNMAKKTSFAAQQTFPLKAADLMPALSGPALGQALRAAEARWIASGFTLTKAELLD